VNLFYLAGGIGLILVLAGFGKTIANLRFLARTKAVEGRFVKWEITEPGAIGGPSGTKGRRSYRPIVAFRADDGSTHQVTGSAYRQAFHAPSVAAGTAFPVRYDASNPKDAQLVTFLDFWLFPLMALIVGIVSLVFAARA
jgi:hypothetical protein